MIMAKRKQIYRHVAKWSPAELRKIRVALEVKHGMGPRAQQLVLDELQRMREADTAERRAWRRTHEGLV